MDNKQAEQNLLGACMVNEKCLPYTVTALKKEDFSTQPHRAIFEAIVRLYKEGLDVDIVTVSDRLQRDDKLDSVGGRAYINDLALDVVTTSNYKSYIKIILDYSKRRQLKELASDILTEADSAEEVDKLLVSTSATATKILTRNEDEEIPSIAEGAMEVYEDLVRVYESGEPLGIPLQFPTLTKWLGGLQGGKVYILAGRPAMGKTALALNIAEYVASQGDKNVLCFSLEMEKKEYAKRLMLKYANTNSYMINNGLVDETTMERLTQSLAYMSELALSIDDKTPCTPMKVELGIINMVNNKGSCDLVVIDYLQLMDNDTRTKDRQADISEISRKLKQLANKYNVPIICLSQLSRALEVREDKHPKLSDLRESGAIEQDADVVLFVYRGEYYEPENIDLRGRAEVIVAKQRDGVSGTIPFAFNGSKCEFKELQQYGGT